MKNKLASIKLKWETGAGYDLFNSLVVLHNPDYFNLRSSWASGVRQRLPKENREVLHTFMATLGTLPPIEWIISLPGEKDAQSVMAAFQALDLVDQVSAFLDFPQDIRPRLRAIIENQKWGQEDFETLKAYYKTIPSFRRTKDQIEAYLDNLANGTNLAQGLSEALQIFYEIFFEEEEKRIQPYLSAGLKNSQALAEKLDLEELFRKLTEGVYFQASIFENTKSITMIPSFWITPRIIHDLDGDGLFVFGIRPENVSLIPGELIPDRIINLLDALSNSTRLKILRYVANENLTATQIASRLRLRAPTVAHHLKMLRLSGLIYISSSDNQKEVYYQARLDNIENLSHLITDFITSEKE